MGSVVVLFNSSPSWGDFVVRTLAAQEPLHGNKNMDAKGRLMCSSTCCKGDVPGLLYDLERWPGAHNETTP
jgi:hypothetical protein